MSTAKITETALYLTFRLETELFAIDVVQVREVLDLCNITKVPCAPQFLKGVINVRG
ncbi:MAG: chemotaxis protein CheW, partial [Desulfobacteraceae bacterium]